MPKVLITGANGVIGRKISAFLQGQQGMEVVRLGFGQDPNPANYHDADLSKYDPSWARQFDGCDCVVHLAANPRSIASWNDVQKLNIDLSLSVFRAAREAHVGRIVFASSNWVMAGYRFESGPIRTDLAPWPVNAYGAAKLFIERVGCHLCETHDMDFISLRIGWVLPGENRPFARMGRGRWGQEMWLSDGDLCRAVLASITAPKMGFVQANVVSRVEGSRWETETAMQAIGWAPKDIFVPVETPDMRLLSVLQRNWWRLRLGSCPSRLTTPAR